MVEFLGAIPINLKSNMWESEDLIKNLIHQEKPPKNGDGAWHAKIRLIDLDGEEFTKTLQSIPTTKKLSKREILECLAVGVEVVGRRELRALERKDTGNGLMKHDAKTQLWRSCHDGTTS
ncbi:hypothetical protein Tco_0827008 [Tanacetum coccineum]